MEQSTPGPWESSKHKPLKTMHNPNAWTVKKHEFPEHPFEGELEDEYGIYPPLGECGPVALVAGKANAALISAAPELLEALRPFANYACDPPCGCHNCKARDAIAKAVAE